jgi:hypothetical protein
MLSLFWMPDGKIIDENSGANPHVWLYYKGRDAGRTLDRLSGPGNKDPEIMMKAIGSAFQGESRNLNGGVLNRGVIPFRLISC